MLIKIRTRILLLLLLFYDKQVQGSHEEREFDLERLGERGMLYYERYFYIAASATFLRGSWPDEEEMMRDLVLDVPQGTAVILKKKVKMKEELIGIGAGR